MIHIELSTTTGKQTTRVQKEARTSIAFEATVPERSHVRVSVDERGVMTVTHAEWQVIGSEPQWVIQNHIAGPRPAAPGTPHSVRQHHVAEGRAG